MSIKWFLSAVVFVLIWIFAMILVLHWVFVDPPVPTTMIVPPNETGDYTGSHMVMDSSDPWTGTARLTIDANGTIKGVTKLPSSDGAIIQTYVDGTVTDSGFVTLIGDAISASPDAAPSQDHIFDMIGKLTISGHKATIKASGKGNEGCLEMIVVSRTITPPNPGQHHQ